MKIKRKDANDVAILEVSGEMYGGPENMKLSEMVDELAEQGKRKLLLDMGKVKWIASTGLGILISTKKRFEDGGGTVKLCGLNERVLTMFQVTKVSTTMQTYDTVDEAIAAFGG